MSLVYGLSYANVCYNYHVGDRAYCNLSVKVAKKEHPN